MKIVVKPNTKQYLKESNILTPMVFDKDKQIKFIKKARNWANTKWSDTSWENWLYYKNI